MLENRRNSLPSQLGDNQAVYDKLETDQARWIERTNQLQKVMEAMQQLENQISKMHRGEAMPQPGDEIALLPPNEDGKT